MSAMRFYTPPKNPWQPDISLKGGDTAGPLSPTRLHGLVELRAEIEDAQSIWGFMAHHPDWKRHITRTASQLRSRHIQPEPS